MVSVRIQTYTVVSIVAVLIGLGALVNMTMTRTAEGQAVDQEKTNKQLDQATKAIDSGDLDAAKGYMQEAIQGLPVGEAKTQLGEAINASQSNDAAGAGTHLQSAIQSLQNSTG